MDENILEKYRVDKADHTLPRRLIQTTRPGGVNLYFTNSGQMWTFYQGGNHPVDEWGCHTELLDDDGSTDFNDLYLQATESPVVTGG